MSSTENAPLANVKDHLSEVVERVEREHGRVVITRHGRPAAILMSVEDLESLEETLQILSNAELMAAIRQADDDVVAGRTVPLTKDEALARARRR